MKIFGKFVLDRHEWNEKCFENFRWKT